MGDRLVRKGLGIGIIVLFIGSNIVSGLNIQIKNTTIPLITGRSNTLYVGGSGPNNYTRIQDAINDSVDGDTVFVYNDSSPYYEKVEVDKSINLIGEDKNTTIIDGGGSGNVINLTKNGTTLSGFTIQKSGPQGIQPYGDSGVFTLSNYNVINNNKILNNTWGIAIVYSSNNILSNNIINNNGVGIIIDEKSDNNNVIKNNINNNSGGIALGCFFSELFPSNNIISWNIIKDNPDYGITLFPGSRTTIYKNHIENSEKGIDLYFAFFTVVKCNNLINLGTDAFFVYSYGTRWSRNYWDDWNGFGVYKIKGYKLIIIWDEYGMPIFSYKDAYNFDWHPAKEPYVITTTQGCDIE